MIGVGRTNVTQDALPDVSGRGKPRPYVTRFAECLGGGGPDDESSGHATQEFGVGLSPAATHRAADGQPAGGCSTRALRRYSTSCDARSA